MTGPTLKQVTKQIADATAQLIGYREAMDSLRESLEATRDGITEKLNSLSDAARENEKNTAMQAVADELTRTIDALSNHDVGTAIDGLEDATNELPAS